MIKIAIAWKNPLVGDRGFLFGLGLIPMYEVTPNLIKRPLELDKLYIKGPDIALVLPTFTTGLLVSLAAKAGDGISLPGRPLQGIFRLWAKDFIRLDTPSDDGLIQLLVEHIALCPRQTQGSSHSS